MTCKDCMHYELCFDFTHIKSLGDDYIEQHNKQEDVCDHFKNKADFVGVETIKSWLYEMAINNVGCHIEGDFSNACEEIISRLEGLKKYSIEKEGADNG